MPVIAKKTVPVATLLCASVLAACAAPAAQALQSTSAAASTGAAVAPGKSTATSSQPSTATSSQPSTATSPQPTSPRQTAAAAQEGVSLATWFGPGLFGRHTACGQLLTRQLVGVASRSLPCGTLVAFSYRGRQVIAPVVDRGPYSSIGASWDLTQHTAKLLKMGGTARLGAKVVGHVQNSPELGAPAGHNAAGPGSPTSPSAGTTGGSAAS